MSVNFAILHLVVASLVFSFYDLRDHKIYRYHLIFALVLSIPFINSNAFVFGISNYLLFYVLHRLSNRGIGMGDVRLSILIGIYAGYFSQDWRTIVYSNLMSWIFAGIVALTLLILRRTRLGDRLAFAPFMFAGLFLSLAI